jgi:hypothetical protein
MATTATPTTASALLARLRPCGPAAEAGELVFDTDPPPDLVPLLNVLHNGVRAAVAGKKWFGCGSTRQTAAARELDPARPVPDGITLLAVEGDGRWDRIRPDARIDLPALFAPPAPPKPKPANTVATQPGEMSNPLILDGRTGRPTSG